jgi:hypothetical protein
MTAVKSSPEYPSRAPILGMKWRSPALRWPGTAV